MTHPSPLRSRANELLPRPPRAADVDLDDEAMMAPQEALHRGRGGVIVSPFLLKRKTKSDPGWTVIDQPDEGRIKEYADDGTNITRIYRHQLAACTYEVLLGHGKLLRWSVPATYGHDDLLISTALTARLDVIDWRHRTARGSVD